MEKYISRHSSLDEQMSLALDVFSKLSQEGLKHTSAANVGCVISTLLQAGYTVSKTISDAERDVRTMTPDELRQELRGLEERDPVNMTSWAEIRFEKIANELSRRDEPSLTMIIEPDEGKKT